MIDSIRALVSEAQHAPTVENCQEWRFRWDGALLHVISDDSRGTYFHNYGNTARLLSLGFVLSHLEIGAAARGLALQVERRALGVTGQVSVGVSFRAASSSLESLRAAIRSRYVDRRAYLPSIVEPAFAAELSGCADSSPNASARVLGTPPESLRQLLCSVEVAFADDQGSRRQLTAWTRMSRREADRTRDGIYWRAWDLPLLALLSMRYTPLFAIGKRFGAMKKTAGIIDRKLTTGNFLCFSCRLAPEHEANLEHFVDLGRVIMRAWLTLVSRGYVAQPFSLSVLLSYFLTNGMLPADTATHFSPLLANAPRVVADAFGVPAGETPLFLVRFGRAASLVPVANRTRRLSLNQVFESSGIEP